MGKSNPLDADLDVGLDEEAEVKPRSELLAHYMASLGFQPKASRSGDSLEFCKTYSDPAGKVARVVSVVKKDAVGLEPEGAQYFTVTVQIHITADEDTIQAKAPSFCRPDLLRILAHFDALSPRTEAEVTECALCGAPIAEFVERDGEATCFDCAKRKGV